MHGEKMKLHNPILKILFVHRLKSEVLLAIEKYI